MNISPLNVCNPNFKSLAPSKHLHSYNEHKGNGLYDRINSHTKPKYYIEKDINNTINTQEKKAAKSFATILQRTIINLKKDGEKIRDEYIQLLREAQNGENKSNADTMISFESKTQTWSFARYDNKDENKRLLDWMRYDTKTSDIIIGKSNGETTTMYNFSNGKLKKIVQTESYSSPRIVAKYDPKDESNYTIKLPSSNIDEEYIDIFSCEFKNDKLISAQERKREYKEDGSSFYRQVKYIF